MKRKNPLPLLFILFLLFAAACPLVFGQIEAASGFLEEVKLFARAMQAVLEGSVQEVKPRDLLYGAARGMIQTLGDKYSEFIEPKRFELLQIKVKGEYAGIGVHLKLVDGVPAIETIQPGGSAEAAGLQVGDKILRVDGLETAQKSLEEVAAMVRGEENSEVILAILRDATGETFDVRLLRRKIEVEAVRDIRMVGKALGYVRVANFQENTVDQFDEAVQDLQKKGMKALIIDLRNNGGGLLPAAVGLSERFLEKDEKIVSVQSKVKVQQKEYFSSGEHVIKDLKLLVLVNELSASASEVFSAAMQDHQRGIVLGAKTYGKASAQSVVPLDEVSAIKLTTARYLSPNGRAVDGVGLEPDHAVKNGPPGTRGSDRQIARALDLLKKYR